MIVIVRGKEWRGMVVQVTDRQLEMGEEGEEAGGTRVYATGGSCVVRLPTATTNRCQPMLPSVDDW